MNLKLTATFAALAFGTLLTLAPADSHADSLQISLNLNPAPVVYAQPVRIVRPSPVVMVQPEPVYYTPAPRPVVVERVTYVAPRVHHHGWHRGWERRAEQRDWHDRHF